MRSIGLNLEQWSKKNLLQFHSSRATFYGLEMHLAVIHKIVQEFEPKVGFEFEFIVEHEGRKYHHLCKITEVIPPKKIAYSWRYKGEVGDSLVTFELSADGDKTKLKLTHEGLETFPKTPAYARKNFEAGWTEIIGSELKKFVESKA